MWVGFPKVEGNSEGNSYIEPMYYFKSNSTTIGSPISSVRISAEHDCTMCVLFVCVCVFIRFTSSTCHLYMYTQNPCITN